MEIPIDGGKFLDTDKQSDLKAMLLEKSHELWKICYDNNIQCFILVENTLGHFHIAPGTMDHNMTKEKIDFNNPLWNKWLNMIHGQIINLSKACFRIVYCPPIYLQPPADPSEAWKNS